MFRYHSLLCYRALVKRHFWFTILSHGLTCFDKQHYNKEHYSALSQLQNAAQNDCFGPNMQPYFKNHKLMSPLHLNICRSLNCHLLNELMKTRTQGRFVSSFSRWRFKRMNWGLNYVERVRVRPAQDTSRTQRSDLLLESSGQRARLISFTIATCDSRFYCVQKQRPIPLLK